MKYFWGVTQTLPCCFCGVLRSQWRQWEMLVLALRCCFAEINMTMAPSLWTRMQKQPWPDQTSCFRCYPAACSTVLVCEEKGKRLREWPQRCLTVTAAVKVEKHISLFLVVFLVALVPRLNPHTTRGCFLTHVPNWNPAWIFIKRWTSSSD